MIDDTAQAKQTTYRNNVRIKVKKFGPVISLLTDFGEQDGYVAAMKGVVLKHAPDAVVVDACHHVPPQDVQYGSWVLNEMAVHYPPNSVHIAVVDPGVGTDRSIALAGVGDQWYLAPDNGLLTWVLSGAEEVSLFRLKNSFQQEQAPSQTFHGRDLFSVAAAYLVSEKQSLEDLFEPIDAVQTEAWCFPHLDGDQLLGNVVHIDRFGNLITNIQKKDIEKAGWKNYRIQLMDFTLDGVSRTYGEATPGTLIALFNSSDRLEVAVVNGSAAEKTGTPRGAKIDLVEKECTS